MQRVALAAAAAAASCGVAASPYDPLVRPPAHRVLSSGLCDLTGAYVDGSGNEALLAQAADRSLLATAVTPVGWTTAPGALAADGATLWLNFAPGGNLSAEVAAACTELRWSTGTVWRLTAPAASVRVVHAVMLIHLDVGFTLLANDVCEEYFQRHFPSGIALSAALRAAGGPAQYSITTHPWLLLEFLDGTAGCGRTPRTPAQIAAVVGAIARGDIRWHGKPMNNFVELEDGPWFASSLQLSGELNARFNKSWGALATKSTDVPGMSKSAIPWLSAAGKKSIHMGYNSACRVPDIPQAFNWLHVASGTQLLTFVTDNYGSEIRVPGSDHALAFLYSPDNSGPPPDAAAVATWWAATQARYPNATILLSSLDDFTRAVLPLADRLPQVSGEIGQSWSYGAPADPNKLAAVRALRRLRNGAVEAGWLDADDADLRAFERRLWVGGPEHNWGLCFGCFLGPARTAAGNWSNELFHPLRSRADYAFIESGNLEKRNFTQPLAPSAAASAGWRRYLAEAAAARAALAPSPPDLAGFSQVSPADTFGACGRFAAARFSAADGSLAALTDGATGWQWVAPGAAVGLGAFAYRTYTEADFDVWNREYNPNCGPPCGDFAKQGMDSAAPVNKTWLPTLQSLWRRNAPAQPCSFLAQLALDPATVALYGGMASIYLNFTLDPDPLAPAPTVAVTLSWLGKTSTRMAEAAWLSFAPNVGGAAGDAAWTMDILGLPVSPLEVVPMGTRHIHAVDDGVASDTRAGGGPLARIRTLDTPLVSPGDREHLLWYDGDAQPDMAGGWHFDLSSNVWGTAFPQVRASAARRGAARRGAARRSTAPPARRVIMRTLPTPHLLPPRAPRSGPSTPTMPSASCSSCRRPPRPEGRRWPPRCAARRCQRESCLRARRG